MANPRLLYVSWGPTFKATVIEREAQGPDDSVEFPTDKWGLFVRSDACVLLSDHVFESDDGEYAFEYKGQMYYNIAVLQSW